MKKDSSLIMVLSLFFISFLVTLSASGQKNTIGQSRFRLTNSGARTFVPFKITDFTPSEKSRDNLFTLPNKKKVKLSTYVNAVNQLESRLSAIGIAKDRLKGTVIASRIEGLEPSSQPVFKASTASSVTTQKAMPPIVRARFSRTANLQVTDKIKSVIRKSRAAEVEKLPNYSFNRTETFEPPVFSLLGYKARVFGSVHLKGTVDPFVVPEGMESNSNLTQLIKETQSSFTAGLTIAVHATLPEAGELVAYKLESEFTANSNKSARHKSKAKLTVLQQVMINEDKGSISGDNYAFNDTKLYNLTRLMGSADIFSYGMNMLLPVDFYLYAVGLGAGVDVSINKTGLSGTVGPKLAHSIILETSLTETTGIGGEFISTVVDAGVAGELRLAQGGMSYGFKAGLNFENNQLVLQDDMQALADMEFLRGRLYTFYQYPLFVCDNIFLQGGDLKCWEMRRVENDLFDSGSALKFQLAIVDEDKSAPVSWF